MSGIPEQSQPGDLSGDQDEIEVARMLPFSKSILSPMMIILIVLTFGVGLILILFIRTSFPQQVWIDGDRLFGSQRLPDEGVPLNELQLQLVNQRLLFFTLNRFMMIHFTDAEGKKRFVSISQVHHGKDSVDRAMQLLSG